MICVLGSVPAAEDGGLSVKWQHDPGYPELMLSQHY